MMRFDTHEISDFALDLPKLGFKATKLIDEVLEDGVKALADRWRANAEETSGKHGKHYPKSIDHERLLGTNLGYEVGPNPAKKQGRMQFEFGSVNQPPHLDGQRAADVQVPLIARRVDSALGLLGLG